MDDRIHTVRGVGGTEAVFARRVEYLEVGECRWENCQIEVGAVDCGIEINGILGLDFLLAADAVIDLRTCQLEFASASAS